MRFRLWLRNWNIFHVFFLTSLWLVVSSPSYHLLRRICNLPQTQESRVQYADLIGTLDVEERARGKTTMGKIQSHLLPTWYKKRIFMHLIISRTRTRESKVTTLSQNKTLSSRRNLTRKRMKGALFAGALSTRLVCVLVNL
jgi:hypothetical protein